MRLRSRRVATLLLMAVSVAVTCTALAVAGIRDVWAYVGITVPVVIYEWVFFWLRPGASDGD